MRKNILHSKIDILIISTIVTIMIFLNITIATSFDYILGVENTQSIIHNTASKLDMDVLDSDKEVLSKLKDNNKTLIGYINAGSIENYREDYDKFPKSVIGKVYPGREDERFLDIKNYQNFSKFILKYLDIAKEKGFDAIEFDNIDTFDDIDEIGFLISQQDEINYLNFLEKETHKRGLKIYQKNAPGLILNLVGTFDGAIVEGGFYYKMIEEFSPYTEQDKPVFDIEYTDNTDEDYFIKNICPQSQNLGITSILKNRNLDEFVISCDKKTIKKNTTSTTKEKLKNILNLFYKTIDQKYQNIQTRISFLKTFIQKIDLTKNNKSNKKSLIELLDYLQNSFVERIKFYENEITK